MYRSISCAQSFLEFNEELFSLGLSYLNAGCLAPSSPNPFLNEIMFFFALPVCVVLFPIPFFYCYFSAKYNRLVSTEGMTRHEYAWRSASLLFLGS